MPRAPLASDALNAVCVPPWPIVGAFFRPPAKALLAVLPSGCDLVLQPDRENPYDEHAIGVHIASETLEHALSPAARVLLEDQLPAFGFALADLFVRANAPEWHLGYIPNFAKKGATERPALNDPIPATLVFDASGAACAEPSGPWHLVPCDVTRSATT